MNYCKVCGKKLELTPEYDMCLECQGKQHQTFTIPNNIGSVSNKIEMTPKEAFEKIKRIVKLLQRKLETNEQDENMDIVDNALAELEELKRDVKRYFELANGEEMTKEVIDEFSKIRDKLWEVGREE